LTSLYDSDQTHSATGRITMPAITQTRVHRIDDRAVIEACQKVMEVFIENEPTGSLVIIPGLSLPINDDLNVSTYAGKYLISRAGVNVNLGGEIRFNLNFTRQIKDSTGEAASALYNDFECLYFPEGSNWQARTDKVLQVQEILGAIDVPLSGGAETGPDGTLRELIVGFGAQHRSMLASLDQAIKNIELRRRELDEENAAREMAQKEAHKDALDQLDRQRSELERQSHMAERRRLLRELTTATKERVRESIAPRGAIYSRWAVFGTSLLVSGLTAFLAISSFAALGAPILGGTENLTTVQQGAIDWVILTRAIVSSVISVGALIYAASWLRGFYNADLSAAREIERFTYDLNRASWVIETVLEVQQEKKGQVPEAWVEGVTRGLFDDRRKDTPNEATKALSALLGYTASASFGPEGPQFDINRRGARRLAKSSDADTDT